LLFIELAVLVGQCLDRQLVLRSFNERTLNEGEGGRMALGDAFVEALSALVAGGVARGGTRIGDGDTGRMVGWVEAGSGHPGPTVILAAGRNDTAISWAPLLAALAASTRVVAYDRAGLGASDPDPGPGPPAVDRQVADLAAVIGQTGAGPCVVVGHSWGGLLAVGHPGLVCGLVLVDPAHPDLLASLPRPVRWLNRSVAEHLPSLLLALGLLEPVVRRTARRTASRFSDDPRVRSLVAEAYLTHARRSQVQASRDELRGIAASAPLLRQARAASSLPDVPVVVLSATRGVPPRLRQRWTQLQAGVAAAARTGRGRHVVVADAGHAIHHDRPDLVAAAVLEVVEEARPARSDPGNPDLSGGTGEGPALSQRRVRACGPEPHHANHD
jgi:pimeloyl-ACP methyl ester carboxylesterase